MNLTANTLSTVLRIIKIVATSKRRDIDLRSFGSVLMFGYTGVVFKTDLYAYGECLAIQLYHEVNDVVGIWHEPLATLTINVPDHGLAPGCFFAKTYGENTFLRYPLLSQGWFEDTGDRVGVGMTHVEVWKPSQKFCDAFLAAHQAEVEFLNEHALV